MELMGRIERSVVKLPDSPGCWLWTGALNRDGYAQGWIGERAVRRWVRIHRVTYELWRGPIPVGMELDHLCRVRCCVNPHHLEAVVTRENVLRGYGPAGVNARKTTCRFGHPLDRAVRNKRNGQLRRHCRPCMNASVARYQRRKAGMARPGDEKQR